MKPVVFSDFDGTISSRDVGYHLFHHFSNGKNDKLIPDWKSGSMSSRECLTREAEMITATVDQLEKYLQQHEIDPTFSSFVTACQRNNIELTILSDGLDFYIERLLAAHGLADLPWLSNHAVINNDKMTIEFPHDNGPCVRCGNCKGQRIREFRQSRSEEAQVIFIGDGYSDACATAEADIIFAKKDLEQYCQKNNIEYVGYRDFSDVTRQLKQNGLFKQTG
ncbi:MAG: MtnX-like HAD-IB family phosphatase [bacterium]|nr:MtnX-like HAD-IB family phosphatase [bacterium]